MQFAYTQHEPNCHPSLTIIMFDSSKLGKQPENQWSKKPMEQNGRHWIIAMAIAKYPVERFIWVVSLLTQKKISHNRKSWISFGVPKKISLIFSYKPIPNPLAGKYYGERKPFELFYNGIELFEKCIQSENRPDIFSYPSFVYFQKAVHSEKKKKDFILSRVEAAVLMLLLLLLLPVC